MDNPQEITTLADADRERFTELVATIDLNAKGFIEVGNALNEIHEKELWRDTHKSFSALCSDRWGFGQSRSYQLIESARVVGRILSTHSTIVETPLSDRYLPTILPFTESQTRELAKVPDADQAEVWAQVTAKTDNPTAKIVRAVVKSWNKLKAVSKPKKKPKPPSEPKPKTVSDEDSLPNGGKAYKRDALMPEWFMDDNRVAVPVELYPAWRAKQRYAVVCGKPPNFETCAELAEIGRELEHEPTIELSKKLRNDIAAFGESFRKQVCSVEPSVVIDGKWYSQSEVADA